MILDHNTGSYDGSFFALCFFRNARQECFSHWKKCNYEIAFQLLKQCEFWWNEFIIRRNICRNEFKHEIWVQTKNNPERCDGAW